MGLVPPHSPSIITLGGGTSLFSVPGEETRETPHTSNVSLATSITSVSANSRQRLTPKVQHSLAVRHDGLQLRHTVKMVASLLQNLTVPFLQLGKEISEADRQGERPCATQRCVRVCNEMQQQYLQLVAIARNDYKVLRDKFRLQAVSTKTDLALASRVSDHESEQMVQRYERYRRGRHCEQLQPLKEKSSENMHGLRKQIAVGEGTTMFSPSTEDMRSIPDRRLVGCPSNEYNGCGRDAFSYGKGKGDEQDEHCHIGFDVREDSEKWRRMYDNISLAASSIRSTANHTPK